MTSRPPFFFFPLVVPQNLSPRFVVALAAGVIGAGRIALEGMVRLAAGHLVIPPVAVDAMSVVGLVAVFVVLAPLVQAAMAASLLEGLRRLGIHAPASIVVTVCVCAAGQGWVGGVEHVAATLWTFSVVCSLYRHLRLSRPAAVASGYAMLALAAGNAIALAFILGA